MSARLQTIIRIVVGLAALAIVVFALRGVDLQQALSILLSANLAFLVATLVVQAVNMTLRLLRWRFLLMPVQHVPLRTLVSPLLISFAVGNVTFTGAGAVPRVYITARRTGLDGGFIAGTVVEEFLLDATAVILWATLVPFVVSLPPQFRTLQIIFAFPLVLLLLTGLAAVRRQSLVIGLLVRTGLWQRIVGLLPSWISDNLDTLGYGMSAAVAQRRTLIAAVATTVAVWLTEAVVFWLLLLSLSIPFSYLEATAVTAYTNAAISIVVVPGFVGTLEVSSVGLVLALGGTQAAALAFAVLLRVFLIAPSTLLGAFFAWREGSHIGR